MLRISLASWVLHFHIHPHGWIWNCKTCFRLASWSVILEKMVRKNVYCVSHLLHFLLFRFPPYYGIYHFIWKRFMREALMLQRFSFVIPIINKWYILRDDKPLSTPKSYDCIENFSRNFTVPELSMDFEELPPFEKLQTFYQNESPNIHRVSKRLRDCFRSHLGLWNLITQIELWWNKFLFIISRVIIFLFEAMDFEAFQLWNFQNRVPLL